MANIKPHKSLFDKSYAESKTSQYKLYIEIGINGLKQTILNTENNTFIGIEEYNFTDVYNDYSLVDSLQHILKENPIFKQEFKSIQIDLKHFELILNK